MSDSILNYELYYSEKDGGGKYDILYNKSKLYLTYLPSNSNFLQSFIQINSMKRGFENNCFLPYFYDIDPNNLFIITSACVMIRRTDSYYSQIFLERLISDVDLLEEKMVRQLYLSYTYIINERSRVYKNFAYIMHSQVILLEELLIKLC